MIYFGDVSGYGVFLLLIIMMVDRVLIDDCVLVNVDGVL